MDNIDEQDLTKIAVQVFHQALEDYIHLQHPSTRIKKYISEAFLSSIDLFWDPEYRLDIFLNENSEPMNLKEFLCLASNRENVSLENFYTHLETSSKNFWKGKLLNTITIPDVAMICQKPYNIVHAEKNGKIDFNTRTIFCNRKPAEDNNIFFIRMILTAIAYEKDLSIKQSLLNQLSDDFYETLKMNNSFRDPRLKLVASDAEG